MDHEIKIGRQNGSAPSQGMVRSLRGFIHDLFLLTELQIQLFLRDVGEGSRRLLLAGMLSLASMALGVASLPIGLVALGLWLKELLGISYSLGFLSAALIGGMLSFGFAGASWLILRGSSKILQRSHHEWMRNMRWIKRVLERDRVAGSGFHQTYTGDR